MKENLDVIDIKTASRTRTLFILTAAIPVLTFLMSSPLYSADGEDPVEAAIARLYGSPATPETLVELDELIAKYASQPNILKLKVYRARKLKGISKEEEQIRYAISEYEKISQEAGPGSEIDYICLTDIGYLLQHYLDDKEAAYQHFKKMENHPVLSGSDLQSQYRKVEVYTRIVENAYGARKSDEIDKYAKLVMAYPHLGMKDREMYLKFYDLYDTAAKFYIMNFRDDIGKLTEIEIYPSHPDRWKERQSAIDNLLGLNSPDKSAQPDMDVELLDTTNISAQRLPEETNTTAPPENTPDPGYVTKAGGPKDGTAVTRTGNRNSRTISVIVLLAALASAIAFVAGRRR